MVLSYHHSTLVVAGVLSLFFLNSRKVEVKVKVICQPASAKPSCSCVYLHNKAYESPSQICDVQ